MHSFFLFFEARKNPDNAPLAMWLQGGPGVPSTIAAMGENGPCCVTRNSRDTALNPWSWNNEVNMLYLDQPLQTGFSYDTLINGTVDQTTFPTVVTPLSPSSPPPQLNTTFMAGVFPSQDPKATANTTANAAVAAWHFMQTWMHEYGHLTPVELHVDPDPSRFPKYKPRGNKFSIWAESWGGHNGPTFATFFNEQTKKIAAGTLPNAVPLRVETVGIINGCVDILTQITSYPQMAFNNTYGIQVITQAEYDAAMASFPECKRRVEACRALARDKDPGETGSVDEVNTACRDSYYYCLGTMWGGVQSRGVSVSPVT
jgi:carboxypeptidase D